MNELAFATIATMVAFISWELVCYTQLRITKKRNRDLHKRIHGE
jgi:hypothetical protein